MKMYDVLLVNSIADGMNLVAKEGPIVNQKDGVLILSERAGARQQLHQGALVISPVDIFETQVAIHKALSMNVEEKQKNVKILRKIVREEDINFWLKAQLEVVNSITRKSKSRKLEPSK